MQESKQKRDDLWLMVAVIVIVVVGLYCTAHGMKLMPY